MKRARLSCPWCPWTSEAEGVNIAEATEKGLAAIEAHNAEAGHSTLPGHKPKLGYWKGRPLQ